MTPSKHLKRSGPGPAEHFVTTYSSDYKPFSEQLMSNTIDPRTEAELAPAFIIQPQVELISRWIHKNKDELMADFYKTTNSTYGSFSCAQENHNNTPQHHAESSPTRLFETSFLSKAPPPPSVSVATGEVGSALTGSGTEDVSEPSETQPVLSAEEKGQLCVCGGEANVLEQQEARDEQQQPTDVVHEEGVIVLSPPVDSDPCCRDFLRAVCTEAGLGHLLDLPVVSIQDIANKDPKSCRNCFYSRRLATADGLKNNTSPQFTCRQCTCRTGGTRCPESCCYMMKTFPPHIPQGSTSPLVHAPFDVNCTKPMLTEYQASYNAVGRT